jgi:hypothetical protein
MYFIAAIEETPVNDVDLKTACLAQAASGVIL